MMNNKKRKIKKILIIFITSILFVLFLYNRYGISCPKDISDKLSFHIVADKSQYTQAEPVRLTLLISNKTSEPLFIKYHYKIRPLKIKLTQINKNKDNLKISDIIIPVRSIAPHGFGKEFDRRRMTIKPDEPYVLEEWLVNPSIYKTDFGIGDVEFRAELFIKRSFLPKFEHKINSAQININYTKPEGKDAEAYSIITSEYIFPSTHKRRYGLRFINSGPIPAKADLNNFLINYKDTCYAPYVQYSNISVYLSSAAEIPGKKLEELLDMAPSDFPLLPQVYIYLLQYYLRENDLPKMWELSQSISVDGLNIHNTNTKKELLNWINQISWWPPSTPYEQQKADKAFRTRTNVQFAKEHWLTQFYFQTYGEHYRNELQFSSLDPEKVGLYFYDKIAEQCVFVTYYFDKSINLDRIELVGPFSSALIGPLQFLRGRLEKELGLNLQELNKKMIKADIKDTKIEGYFYDAKQKLDKSTFINFSLDDVNLP